MRSPPRYVLTMPVGVAPPVWTGCLAACIVLEVALLSLFVSLAEVALNITQHLMAHVEHSS